jgi:hypothetical protein
MIIGIMKVEFLALLHFIGPIIPKSMDSISQNINCNRIKFLAGDKFVQGLLFWYNEFNITNFIF